MSVGEDELDRILNRSIEWAASGHRLALATVVEIGRSAPRVAGSHLLIRDDGRFEGSVSGGCVEGDVIVQAMQLIDGGGGHRLLVYHGSNGQVWEVGLACGTGITILIQTIDDDHVPQALLAHVRRERFGGRVVPVETDLATGISRLSDVPRPGSFVNIYPPRRRLAIVGAVHIAKMLAPMATLAGYSVTIVEPRQLFAASLDTEHRIVDEWPDEAIERWHPDAGSAVVALTHDPKLDDPALVRGLRSPAFYVGALGSRHTHGLRVERLRAAGLSEDEVSRVHGPVGLPIGAIGPAEIAVSILAEMTAAYRRTSAVPQRPT